MEDDNSMTVFWIIAVMVLLMAGSCQQRCDDCIDVSSMGASA